MVSVIPAVLSSRQVVEARQTLERAEWIDGKLTAGHQFAAVRNNMQLPERSATAEIVGEMILIALQRNPLFASAALPVRILPPLFNRYQRGDTYPSHIDNAIRQVAGTGLRIRTDLSATLFLAEPHEYDGGELLVEDGYGVHKVKLPGGHLALYSSSSRHSVTPVTSGARLASFFWIQSMVRDDARRTMLFELDAAIQALSRDVPAHPSNVQLNGVYQNLLRQWADM